MLKKSMMLGGKVCKATKLPIRGVQISLNKQFQFAVHKTARIQPKHSRKPPHELIGIWWAGRDLNPRPAPREGAVIAN